MTQLPDMILMRGGSMCPTLMAGDELVVQPTRKMGVPARHYLEETVDGQGRPSSFQAGDVVLFRNIDGELVAHRLIKNTSSGWITRGDRNPRNDEQVLRPEQLLAKVANVRSTAGTVRPVPGASRGLRIAARQHLAAVIRHGARRLVDRLFHPVERASRHSGAVAVLGHRERPDLVSVAEDGQHSQTVNPASGETPILLGEAQTLMLSLISNRDSGGFSDNAWTGLAGTAVGCGVQALIYSRLSCSRLTGRLPSADLALLRRWYLWNSARNMALAAELERSADALAQAGIELWALKGMHLAQWIYADPATRMMGDLDILVEKENLRAAMQTFEKMGYKLSHHPDSPILPTAVIVDRQHPQLRIDLHSTLNLPDKVNQIPLEEILARSEPARIGQSTIYLLSAEDLIVQLGAHAYKHGYFRLSQLADVTELLRPHEHAIDWNSVQNSAVRSGAARMTLLLLSLASRLTGAAVPKTALDRLETTVGVIPMPVEAIAESQLFAVDYPRPDLTDKFWSLSDGALNVRAARAWRWFIAPRQKIAEQYGLARNSPRIFLYYPLRLWKYLRRYGSLYRAEAAKSGRLALLGEQHRQRRWLTAWACGDTFPVERASRPFYRPYNR